MQKIWLIKKSTLYLQPVSLKTVIESSLIAYTSEKVKEQNK